VSVSRGNRRRRGRRLLVVRHAPGSVRSAPPRFLPSRNIRFFAFAVAATTLSLSPFFSVSFYRFSTAAAANAAAKLH